MILDAEVQQSEGGVTQAALGPNPKLYLSSEDIRPWNSSFDFANDTEDLGYLGQTIESAGKRSKRVAVAKAKLAQTDANRTLRLREMIGQVALAYWSAVMQQKVTNLLQLDMDAGDEMVAYHQRRVDAGAMKGVDLLRMQIERDRLRVALRTAQRDATQARLELFKQMGSAPSEAVLTDSVDTIPSIEQPSIEAILEQRPDMQAARAAEMASEADLRLQKANAVPDPDLFGGYKRNTGDNTLYGGLQLQLPFRNRNQGEIVRARASITASKANLMALEQQVRTEVSQAYASYQTQLEIVENVLPDMRKRARQNLEIVREAYKIEGVDLLRFIDAERTEFDVEVSALRAMGQLQQSVVQLRLAYGVQP
jgi:cobalt-zinc-cadmium efflux system outer membrane protein